MIQIKTQDDIKMATDPEIQKDTEIVHQEDHGLQITETETPIEDDHLQEIQDVIRVDHPHQSERRLHESYRDLVVEEVEVVMF